MGKKVTYAKMSDPYIHALVAARKSSSVAKLRFLNFRSKHPNGPVIVVEGDDDKIVYSYWISRCREDLAYEFFVCKGKSNVKKLKNVLFEDKSGAQKDVLFFVDRDFDDLAGFACHEHVFMLDRYSVENYLVDHGCILPTLAVAFPGNLEKNIRESVASAFSSDFEDFLKVSAEINFRVFLARKCGADIDDNMPRSVSHFAHIAVGKVISLDVSIIDLLPFDCSLLEDELTALEEEFAKLSPLERYRGKFNMSFFRKWIEQLCSEYRNGRDGIFPGDKESDGKIKHEEFSIGSLAFRSTLPTGFKEFISRY